MTSMPISNTTRKPGFPAGLRVLVVDDDPTCLIILEKMLRTCRYIVRKTDRAEIALTLLRENPNKFDIVISDVHMPDMDGFKLLEHVGLEMDLPVIMMSADDSNHVVMKGITHGACDYLIKPVRIEALRNIWQHVVRKKKNEWKEVKQSSSWDEGDRRQKQDDAVSSPANEGSWKSSKRKSEDDDPDEKDDTTTRKKPRVVWSVELHQQFVAAVNHLSIDKAVPKKILELMDVPGLTRENVASHLQKYRLYLKRLSSQQQGGFNNYFLSQDSGFSVMSSISDIDLQALHVTGQTLAAYTTLPPIRPSMSMPFINQRDLLCLENSKPSYGDSQQQQHSYVSKEMNMHGIPTTTELKQLAGVNQSIQNTGNMNMLTTASSSHQSCSSLIKMSPQQPQGRLLNESVGGHASQSQALVGQPMQSNGAARAAVARNCIAPVVNYSSDLPGDSILHGSTHGFTSRTSKGFNQEGSNLGVKAVDGYVGSYDVSQEIQPQKSQDWQLQNTNMIFGSSFQPLISVNNSVNVVPSFLVNQSRIAGQKPNQNGNTLVGKPMLTMQNVNHIVNSVPVENTSRKKVDKLSNVVSSGSNLFSASYGQDDMMCALLKQVENSL
ncbi:hypothetical protein vseg_011789 [Gypsophila vaccaria]